MNGIIGRYEKTNIFDVNTAQVVNGYFLPSGAFTPYATNAMVFIPIQQGKVYDIYGIVRVSSSTAIKYGTFANIPSTTETDSIRYGSFAQSETLTITAGTNENYIAVMFCGDGDYSAYGSVQNALNINCANMKVDTLQWQDVPYRRYETATDVVTNLPVTLYTDGQPVSSYTIKGNTQTSGTPSPQNPVTIQGVGEETANLFDYEHTEGLLLGVYINQQGQTIENFSYNMSYFIEVQPNAEYTWNFGSTVSHNAPTAAFYDSNGDYISVATHGQGTYFSFTTPNNAAFVRVPIYISTKTAAMLNTGSTALPYEPYGKYKISILKDLQALTPVYLSEPLMKIGDIEDTLNSDGTVTRRIGKIDLGTLNWHLSASHNGICDSTVPNMRIIDNMTTGNAICTSFIEVDANSVGSTSYGFSSCLNLLAKPYINHTGFEGYTDEQFIEALSGVIMYYVLATPTTETVTVPTITTTGGEVTLDVDTTVKPSELDLTYYGWHEHEPKKKSANLFDVSLTTFTNGIKNDNGEIVSSDVSHFTSSYTEVNADTQYTISGSLYDSTYSRVFRLYFYDASKVWISRTAGFSTNSQTFTTPQNCKYIQIQLSVNLDLSDCMLNTGSTALPYVPYWE